MINSTGDMWSVETSQGSGTGESWSVEAHLGSTKREGRGANRTLLLSFRVNGIVNSNNSYPYRSVYNTFFKGEAEGRASLS